MAGGVARIADRGHPVGGRGPLAVPGGGIAGRDALHRLDALAEIRPAELGVRERAHGLLVEERILGEHDRSAAPVSGKPEDIAACGYVTGRSYPGATRAACGRRP